MPPKKQLPTTPKSKTAAAAAVAASPVYSTLKPLTKDELITKLLQSEADNKSLKKIIADFELSNQNLTNDLNNLKNEFGLLKQQINNKTDTKEKTFNDRLVDIERRLYAQEQYSRRECIEIYGFKNVKDEDVENTAITLLNKLGNVVTKQDFHAIHRLKNPNAIILKSVNRRTSQSALYSTQKIKDLSDDCRKELTDLGIPDKFYLNESLSPYYRKLFGKCNALYKLNLLSKFFTRNGTIYIIINAGDNKTPITHLDDLHKLFSKDVIDSLEKNN